MALSPARGNTEGVAEVGVQIRGHNRQDTGAEGVTRRLDITAVLWPDNSSCCQVTLGFLTSRCPHRERWNR